MGLTQSYQGYQSFLVLSLGTVPDSQESSGNGSKELW
jgi:hypothetical protein